MNKTSCAAHFHKYYLILPPPPNICSNPALLFSRFAWPLHPAIASPKRPAQAH